MSQHDNNSRFSEESLSPPQEHVCRLFVEAVQQSHRDSIIERETLVALELAGRIETANKVKQEDTDDAGTSSTTTEDASLPRYNSRTKIKVEQDERDDVRHFSELKSS